MTKDRLKELHERSGLKEEASQKLLGAKIKSKDVFITEIPQKLHLTEEKLEQTRNYIQEIRNHHNVILSSPTTGLLTNNRSEELTEFIQKNMREISKELKVIDKITNDHLKSKKISETEFRMIQTKEASIVTKFRDVWEELYTVRNVYEDRCKGRIQRALEIAGYDANEEEIEEAFETGISVFAKEFSDSQSAKLALQDLQDRHQELLNLEKGVTQVHNMFQELGLLVSIQGEKIDRIEMSIEKAAEEVANTEQTLRSASSKKKKLRKGKCCIITTITCIVLIVGVILILSFLL